MPYYARNRIGYYTKIATILHAQNCAAVFREEVELICLPFAGRSTQKLLLLVLLPGNVSTPYGTSDQICAAVKHSITAVAMVQDGITYTAGVRKA